MLTIKLTKKLFVPSSSTEIEHEPPLNKHERWLRRLISDNRVLIYLGDMAKVSDRWTGDGKNPHEGKTGRVYDIRIGAQSIIVDIGNLVYRLKSNNGELFETPHYTLDRINQTEGNALAEKLLRETNDLFSRRG